MFYLNAVNIHIVHVYLVQYNVIISGVALSTLKTRCNCIMVRYVPQPIIIKYLKIRAECQTLVSFVTQHSEKRHTISDKLQV